MAPSNPRHLDPDTATILAELRDGIATTLGDTLVGLYLYGSVALGEAVSGVSDIDLLAVLDRAPTEPDLDRLRPMHAAIVGRHPAWDDRIEVAYASTHGLRTWRTERSPMGIVSPGEPLHLIDAGADWRINWFFVRDHGVTLAGPPPATLIAPIPREVFLEAARDSGRWWRERIAGVSDPGGLGYAVLTVCRALCTHHTGRHVGKDTAARWAAERYPAWASLIGWAAHQRRDPAAGPPPDPADVARFIAETTPELDRPAPTNPRQ